MGLPCVRRHSIGIIPNSTLCKYRTLLSRAKPNQTEPSRTKPSQAACAVQVIAIDIDATRLEMARHNARVYGVSDAIEFIQACEPAGHSHTEEVRPLRRLTDYPHTHNRLLRNMPSIIRHTYIRAAQHSAQLFGDGRLTLVVCFERFCAIPPILWTDSTLQQRHLYDTWAVSNRSLVESAVCAGRLPHSGAALAGMRIHPSIHPAPT
jgi:hypothetical protein